MVAASDPAIVVAERAERRSNEAIDGFRSVYSALGEVSLQLQAIRDALDTLTDEIRRLHGRIDRIEARLDLGEDRERTDISAELAETRRRLESLRAKPRKFALEIVAAVVAAVIASMILAHFGVHP